MASIIVCSIHQISILHTNICVHTCRGYALPTCTAHKVVVQCLQSPIHVIPRYVLHLAGLCMAQCHHFPNWPSSQFKTRCLQRLAAAMKPTITTTTITATTGHLMMEHHWTFHPIHSWSQACSASCHCQSKRR